MVFAVCLADQSYATSAVSKGLCTLGGAFKGNAGKGIAIISVTVVGIGLLYGKMTWPTALLVGVGIAMIFGVDQLVIALNGIKCR